MSRGVGYIAGVSLDELQTQWGALLEQNVDVILFDRTVLRIPHTPNATDPNDLENNSIRTWARTMIAGQGFFGNQHHYIGISDLRVGDVLVLSRLDVLFHAYSGAWPEYMAAHDRGVHLAILEYGFHSGSADGKMMIKMMNTLFELGSGNCNKEIEDVGVVNDAVLRNDAIQRFEISYTGSLYCPVCGQEVLIPDGGMVNECAHTLFVAHDAGFEYRSQQFDEAMGIVGVDSDDIVTGMHKYDGFTDKVAIKNSVKFANYSPAPSRWGTYVGFVVD